MELGAKELGAIAVTTITTLGAWFGGLRQGRAQFINAVHQAADQVINRYEVMADRLAKRLDEAEARNRECQVAHEECRDKVRELRTQIEDIMRGPIATYEIINSHPRLEDKGGQEG